MKQLQNAARASVLVCLSAILCCNGNAVNSKSRQQSANEAPVIVHRAMHFDVSHPFESAHPVVSPKTSAVGCCSLSPNSAITAEQSNDPAPAPKAVMGWVRDSRVLAGPLFSKVLPIIVWL